MGKSAIENKLIKRILIGWNTQRVIMLVLGIFYLVSSIVDYSLVGILFSIFITSQSVFGYGCAGGSCPID